MAFNIAIRTDAESRVAEVQRISVSPRETLHEIAGWFAPNPTTRNIEDIAEMFAVLKMTSLEIVKLTDKRK